VIFLVTLPFRLGFFAGKTTYKVSRILGWRRLALVGIGAAVGLLLAPVPGAELRTRLRRRFDDAAVSDVDLGDRVRFELAHHPRTWHLAQPDVAVQGRRVTLRGAVPDEAARTELVRAAGALAGVAAVDDGLTVTGTDPAG
jgi:hypothetical protein